VLSQIGDKGQIEEFRVFLGTLLNTQAGMPKCRWCGHGNCLNAGETFWRMERDAPFNKEASNLRKRQLSLQCRDNRAISESDLQSLLR
jgi:hypothetical protein